MLSADRNTPYRGNEYLETGVKAGSKIYAGAMVGILAGLLVPAAAIFGLVAVGRAEAAADNANGNDGDVTCRVRKGVPFKWANSANADAISAADIGQLCFVVDDQTVAKTSNGGLRPIAGMIEAVDADGVWVMPGALARKAFVTVQLADLVAADAKVTRIASPVAGRITAIRSVLEGHALAAGDATLTAKIGATAVTGGVITITQAGSAIGDADVATPTGANDDNAVDAGGVISLAVGGANTDATASARVTIEISY